MTPQKDDGGPAFPIQTVVDANGNSHWGSNGLSKREYFASKVLAGMANEVFTENIHTQTRAVNIAVQFADALIERLKR